MHAYEMHQTLRAKLDKHGRQHEASVKDMQTAHKEEVQNLKKDNSEYLTIIQHLKDQVSESETSHLYTSLANYEFPTEIGGRREGERQDQEG